jgi:16S rRNA (cytidine1402-2'-O)-methyltransferase
MNPYTLIYYESPYRLSAFLKDALEVFGDRNAAVANDLTKKFERVDRGRLQELAEKFTIEAPRGEYTVVISGTDFDNKNNIFETSEE